MIVINYIKIILCTYSFDMCEVSYLNYNCGVK